MSCPSYDLMNSTNTTVEFIRRVLNLEHTSQNLLLLGMEMHVWVPNFVQLKVGETMCHKITKQLDDGPFSTKEVATNKCRQYIDVCQKNSTVNK